MIFFRKRKHKVAKLMVARTTIISCYNENFFECGPFCFDTFLLVYEKRGNYYEFFSGRNIKKESDISKSGIPVYHLSIPYVVTVLPLSEYLNDQGKMKYVSNDWLFDFLVDLNTQEMSIDVEHDCNDEDKEAFV